MMQLQPGQLRTPTRAWSSLRGLAMLLMSPPRRSTIQGQRNRWSVVQFSNGPMGGWWPIPCTRWAGVCYGASQNVRCSAPFAVTPSLPLSRNRASHEKSQSEDDCPSQRAQEEVDRVAQPSKREVKVQNYSDRGEMERDMQKLLREGWTSPRSRSPISV
jgi:hypothetical protein